MGATHSPGKAQDRGRSRENIRSYIPLLVEETALTVWKIESVPSRVCRTLLELCSSNWKSLFGEYV